MTADVEVRTSVQPVLHCLWLLKYRVAGSNKWTLASSSGVGPDRKRAMRTAGVWGCIPREISIRRGRSRPVGDGASDEGFRGGK